MHASVRDYVEMIVNRNDLRNSNVLEVGSLDVNGNVRHLFNGQYYGIDRRPGKGVDFVGTIDEDFGLVNTFDVGLYLETAEHDLWPWQTLVDIHNHVRKGGYVIMTTRGFTNEGMFPYHPEPYDLWRFTMHSVNAMMAWAHLDVVDIQPDPAAIGVFATARSRG